MLPQLPASVERQFAPADVHEEAREYATNLIGALVFAILLTLVYCVLIMMLLGDSVPKVVTVLLYIITVGTTGFIALGFTKANKDGRYVMMLAITAPVLGPFGTIGVILSIFLQVWHRRFSIPFATWFASIFPSTTPSVSAQIYEDIVTGRDETSKTYSVMPFLDIVRLGTEAQKREVLSRMTANFHPEFAPAFKAALGDSSNTIRVQAATAIARVENLFMERLMKLTALHEVSPDDADSTLALAEHYDAHAFTGILDAERERINRQEALKHYREYLRLKPSDVRVRNHIGRLLLRSGEYDRAVSWFKESMDEGYKNETMLLWYMEALFHAGKYAELRNIAYNNAAAAETLRNQNPALADSVQLWTDAHSYVPAPKVGAAA